MLWSCRLGVLIACTSGLFAVPPQANGPSRPAAVTFHADVLPILTKRCVSCHGPGGGLSSFGTYEEARPLAAALWEAVKSRRMPPWPADPTYGEFANDPRLTDNEIRVFELWAAGGAPPGKPPKPRSTAVLADTQEFSADLMVTAPRPIAIPAGPITSYRYLVLPFAFTRDRWVRAAEIRPSDPSLVDHAVLYVRHDGSDWLRDLGAGVPFAPAGPEALAQARRNTADILAIYTRGSPVMRCPDGMAKKVPAGAALVLEILYVSKETDATDQPQVGLAFATEPPRKRLVTLRLGRDGVRVSVGAGRSKTSVTGALQADALLTGLFPYLHRRGVGIDFDVIGPNGHAETILKVRPLPFDWTSNYVLRTPRLLPAGSLLRWTGHFDTTAERSTNRDATVEARRGEQSWEAMTIGTVDVAVDAGVNGQTLIR